MAMYDEQRFATPPTQQQAQKILAEYEAGECCLHPVSEPGILDRLKTLAAGGSVDPAFFGGLCVLAAGRPAAPFLDNRPEIGDK